jgi:signal transduction histidine kinase
MSHEIVHYECDYPVHEVVLKTDLTDKQRIFNNIKLSGDALIVLINDILDLAKVDAGKMTLKNTFKYLLQFQQCSMCLRAKIKEKNLNW